MRRNASLFAIAMLLALIALPAGQAASNSTCPAARTPTKVDLSQLLGKASTVESKSKVVGLLSLSPYSLGTEDVWRKIAINKCGTAVANRSWVVFYFRPQWAKSSASIAEGVSYFAWTKAGGWDVWYRYK